MLSERARATRALYQLLPFWKRASTSSPSRKRSPSGSADVSGRRGEAFYDLLLIIFISLLVVVSSWSFNEVAEDIVVRPVADMLRVVSKVGRSLDMLKRDAQQAEYETDFLEHSIGKISELLRLGFGTTDALLGDGGGATLAVEGATAIESVRIQAAFAFLDIHNLTLNNNHVKSDVVFSYVSVVAHLVRAALDRYRGGEARNAANSFLLVWRSRKSELEAPESAVAPAGDRPGWGGLSYDDLPEVSCCDAAFEAGPKSNLRFDRFDAMFSAVLRELDESNRSVQKSLESTSMWPS